MAKVNFKRKITGYDGKGMLQPGEKEGGKETMLGHVCIVALNAPLEREKDLAADKKIHRGILSQDIYNAMTDEEESGDLDLPSEDITMIKDLLNSTYGPSIVLCAYNILDPKPKDVVDNKVDSK